MRLLLILLLLVSNAVYGKIDIQKQLKIWNDSEASDSARMKAIDAIAWSGYLYSKPDSAIYYANLQLDLAKKIGFKREEALALNTIGSAHDLKGEFDQALVYYQKSYDKNKVLNHESGMAAALNNMATVYRNLGGFIKAIELFQESYKIKKRLNDEKGCANTLLGIGNVFKEMGDWNKAEENFRKSLSIRKKINDRKGIANSLISIGNIHWSRESYRTALEFYQESLIIQKDIGDQKGIAVSYNNLGNIYKEMNDYSKAIENFHSSLIIRREISDKMGISTSLIGLGSVHSKLNAFDTALEYGMEAREIALEVGAVKQIMEVYYLLYEVYKKKNNYVEALKMHEQLLFYKDSILNDQKHKEVANLQYQFLYELKTMADSIKHNELKKLMDEKLRTEKIENEKKQAELEVKKQQQYALFGGLSLVIVFSVFLYNRFRVTKKQKSIIEKQKEDVEEQKLITENQKDLLELKNKEITDSINYAQRIQNAILPSRNSLGEHLNNGIVFYRPKEIVSGDFYYLDVVEENNQKLIYFAVVDCTGHGVPGSMVSLMGFNGLKRSVQEFGLRKPGEILDKLNELVTESFSQNEEKIRDGMDISLVLLNSEIGSEDGFRKFSIQWAGANNPLWVINPNRTSWPEDMSVFKNGGGAEIKATKQAIGYSENQTPFENHELELIEGDSIFIFSDGYADQFGGEFYGDDKAGGKKFKTSNLRKLLVSIYNEPMDEQKKMLAQTFDQWKGDLEQVDDVCIIGVRL